MCYWCALVWRRPVKKRRLHGSSAATEVTGVAPCSIWGRYLRIKRFLVCICPVFFQAGDGIRYRTVTGVQTCALPIFGVVVLVIADEGVDDLARFLAGGGVVEIDQRVAVDLLIQDREVAAERRPID